MSEILSNLTGIDGLSQGIVTVIITIVFLCFAMYFLGKYFKKRTNVKVESNFEMMMISLFEGLSTFSYSFLGEERGKKFAPLSILLFSVIFIANSASLLSFQEGATAIIFPMTFAFTMFFFWHIYAIYTLGGIKYIKGYFEGPLVFAILMFPIEVLGRIFVPVSLSMRMFGNIISGYLIMKIYWFAMISGITSLHSMGTIGSILSIFVIMIAVVIAAALAGFFSLFAPYIQATVFTSLTMSNINMLVDEEE